MPKIRELQIVGCHYGKGVSNSIVKTCLDEFKFLFCLLLKNQNSSFVKGRYECLRAADTI